jgi:hypothetical protein
MLGLTNKSRTVNGAEFDHSILHPCLYTCARTAGTLHARPSLAAGVPTSLAELGYSDIGRHLRVESTTCFCECVFSRCPSQSFSS